MSLPCPICGETDPLPQSVCLPKLTGDAEPGKPCPWSLEGAERMRVAMEAQSARFEAERTARQQEPPHERP